MLSAQALDKQGWLATGGWNQECEHNVLGPLLTAEGGWLDGPVHRWTSSRRIDWAISTVPCSRLAFAGPENQRAISDHQGFWPDDEVQTSRCGRLKPPLGRGQVF